MTVALAAPDTGAASGPPAPRVAWRPEAIAVLASATALLVQVIGYAVGWSGHEQLALVLWYVGFIAIVAPFAWLLLAPSRTGHQRLAASLGFALIMYLSWFLSDPVLATRFDETQHVTTLVDLIDRHRLFYPNSTLPVSPHYPGLELVTAGVHWVTGLPLIASSFLVVLVSRALFTVSLFLLASRIGRSTRVGSTVVLLYGGSPQFWFFNSQFAYQTVAIAMVVTALYLLVRAFDSTQERPWRLLIVIQACLAALAVTHHLTSWLTVVLLWAMALAFRLGGQRRRARLTLLTAELATVVVAAWTALITPLLINYLGPIFNIATDSLLTALDGSGAREVGVSSSGQATPTWELMVIAGSILLWTAMLVPSAWGAWRRGTLGASRARYLPLGIAAIYPFLQVGRFSVSAAEVADRASTFVTMALALVVGVWLAPRVTSFSKLLVPGAIVLVLGGTILGSGPDWQRITGPFLPGAEQRSVDAETVAVSQWAGTYLPEDAHVGADTTFSRVLPNFAPVVPVTQPAGYESLTPLFIAQSLSPSVLKPLFDDDVDFLVIDTRLVGTTVYSGAFFEGGPGYGPQAATVTAAQVDKFEGAPGFRLVLDGPVKVYDVRGLRGVAQTFPTPREAPGIPGSWTGWQIALTALLAGFLLAMRGGYVDPRRFRAADLWRLALIIPVAMALGLVGIAAQFHPVAGAAVAVLATYAVIVSTRRLPRRGHGRTDDARVRPADDSIDAPAGGVSGGVSGDEAGDVADDVAGARAGAGVGGFAWICAIVLVLVLAGGLATATAWHALLDHPALPAPSAAARS